MQKLIWQNANGEELNLTSGNYGITNWEGFANTSLNIQSQQVPFQDGGVFLDALIEQRELSVTLAMQDNGNLEERYEMRRELIHILNPKLGEGYLIYSNDFISKRIKCIPQIPLFENHNSNDSGTPKASLAWTACEPYWEDLDETIVVIEKGERLSIINEGDIICGININLQTGYIQEPFIKNLTQSKVVKLNGDFNQDIKIDTNVGHKSITQEQLNFNLQSIGMWLNQIAYSPLLNITIIANKWGSESIPDGYGKNGLISYDGVNWELLPKNIKSIYWCKETSIFIACECIEEYRYQIIISEDGVNWKNSGNEITLPIHQFLYNPITKKYIGIGGDSYYSEDLITWDSISNFSGGSNSLLIQPDGTLLIAEHNGIYRGSIESVTKVLNINLGNNAQICYSPELSKYVACGRDVNKLYTSIDGINWVEGVTIGSYFNSIKYENGNFILNVNNITKKSVNAEVWVDINNNEQISDCLYIYEYGVYLFAGYGCLYSSNNLQDWESIFNDEPYDVGVLKYNPILNIYIMILKNHGEGTLWVSSDLKSWNFIYDLGVSDINDIIINSENGAFIVTGNQCYYSSNGVDFTLFYGGLQGVNKGIHSPELHKYIIITSEYYIAGEPSNSKIIIIDDNDINQIEEINVKTTYNIDTFLKDIIYNSEQNLYVIIGEHNGYIGKSSNGTTWTFTATIENGSSDGFQVSLLLYSNRINKYIGVKDKKIGQSVDGVTWSVNAFALPENIKAIIETDKYGLVVVGENGYMASSYNGNEWIVIPTSTKMNIYTISYLQDFLLGLDFGVIVNSQQISNKNIISSLSNMSDMTLGLNIGNNEILFNAGAGNANCTISYRQKYIGV